jgi:hypothetical protein
LFEEMRRPREDPLFHFEGDTDVDELYKLEEEEEEEVAQEGTNKDEEESEKRPN